MRKIKLVALAVMLTFLVTIPGFVNADESLVSQNKLIVFKIGDLNYYTQVIGTDKVDSVKMDAAPMISSDRTFVPVRYLGNALGVSDNNIAWDNNTRTATLQGKNELKLTIGRKAIAVNNKESVIDVAPMIANPGRTMLPARYVAEGLGFTVDWDADNQLVIVYQGERPDVSAIIAKIKGIEKPVVKPLEPKVETKVVDLGRSSDGSKRDIVEVAGYNLNIGNSGVSDPGIWFGITDSTYPKKDIKVVCTSHKEWNESVRPMIDGTSKQFPMDRWTNSFKFYKRGYSPVEPKSGDKVTFDVYGKVDGSEVKLATITKTLP